MTFLLLFSFHTISFFRFALLFTTTSSPFSIAVFFRVLEIAENENVEKPKTVKNVKKHKEETRIGRETTTTKKLSN